MTNNDLTATGILRISAFSPTVGRPAPGTEITVTDPQNGQIMAQGITDNEGILSSVLLPAPPEAISLTVPDSSQTPESEPLPFSQYDITARSAEGFETIIKNAQIYADTISGQNIIFPGQSSSILVPPPAILGGFPEKIPENETKPLPDAGGTVVLPEPVVPEYIIVHAGVPDDRSAADYTIGFKDYIKNVACSEIYDTWPEEAIKANVLAIISFTLNRVYTEWYRNKGYSFTITSSTAFDQAFTYGRTIFDTISDIVDEMFTMFISRSGQKQPLFAQYCDGVRVQRRGWLSQWGSKRLADQGLSAFAILRNFYGGDIVLREASRVSGIPVSFQGVLSFGSTGSAVRTIQSQLNAISENYPLIPKLAVDGIFGRKTEESVRTFQRIFGLPVNGIVNFGTWYAISDIYVAVRRLSELD